MTASVGRAIVFKWGSDSPPAVAGVREKSLTLNGEPIDITSDDDEGWRKLLGEASQLQVDLAISGVTKDDTLKNDWFNGNISNTASLEYPNGKVLSGTFILTNYTETATYNDAVTFEATLQSSGVVTYNSANT